MHRILIVTLTILLFLTSPLYADWTEESGILEPVQIFDQYYGTDKMQRVAQVVSDDFRNGQPKSEWTAEVSRQLRDIRYERLRSEIKGVVSNEDTATVLMRVNIGSLVGPVEHEEVFRLIRYGDTWLIDGLEVTNEKIKPQGIEI
jgi:predicted RNA-binding Zn ribbon-like protein